MSTAWRENRPAPPIRRGRRGRGACESKAISQSGGGRPGDSALTPFCQAEVLDALAAEQERPMGGADVVRVLHLVVVGVVLIETDIATARRRRPPRNWLMTRAEGGPLRRLGEAGVDLLQLVLHRLDELHGADQGQLVGDLRPERETARRCRSRARWSGSA